MRICNSVLILICFWGACVGGIPRLGVFLPRWSGVCMFYQRVLGLH